MLRCHDGKWPLHVAEIRYEGRSASVSALFTAGLFLEGTNVRKSEEQDALCLAVARYGCGNCPIVLADRGLKAAIAICVASASVGAPFSIALRGASVAVSYLAKSGRVGQPTSITLVASQ